MRAAMMQVEKRQTLLLDRWRHTLEKKAEQPAVFNPQKNILRRFSQIEEDARAAEALLHKKAGRGVIGLQAANHFKWPALLLAIFRHGSCPLLLDPQMQGEQLEQTLRQTGCGALFTIEDDEPILQPLAGSENESPCADLLKLTSGSTGAPRAIRFYQHQLVADCDNICATMYIGENDLNFALIPFSHSYGFSNLVTPLLCRGIPLVLANDVMPEAIIDQLTKSSATIFPGLPAFFNALCRIKDDAKIPRLRTCISAGAPISSEVIREFHRRYKLKIHSFYGASECGGICYDRSDDPAVPHGFVGAPLEGVQLEFKTPEGGVRVRSNAVAAGYWPSDSAAEAFIDGAFSPPDLLQPAENGYLITGRLSEFINVGGRKIHPHVIEEILRNAPGVIEAAAFGVRSESRNEEPVAYVAGPPELNSECLLEFCRKKLRPWEAPREIRLVREIPRNARGKISRRDLAAAWASRRVAVETRAQHRSHAKACP